MTNRDRDGAAKLLLALAERLAAAPATTMERAKSYHTTHGVGMSAHQAGALELECSATAAEVRRLVAEYLTARPAKARIPRGKR